MNSQLTAQTLDVSPAYYFKSALRFMRTNKTLDAISHIDCAIIFSAHSPFYIYQKIKFLYALNEFKLCSSYILNQLNYLHHNASLYILCKVIHYYQLINNLSSENLKQILVEKGVPLCLGDEYTNTLKGIKSNLLPYAQKAFIQDNFSLCIDYCSLMIKRHQITHESMHLTAQAYHMLGDVTKACEYYKKCIAINSEYAAAYNDVGLALMELGQFSEALEYLEKARMLHPENVDYLSHIAECYYALKKYDLAQKTFENIIKIHPSCLQTYFSLSYVCKKQNKKLLSKKYMKVVRKRLKKSELQKTS